MCRRRTRRRITRPGGRVDGVGSGGEGGGVQHELAAPSSYASAECTRSCSCETCTHMCLYPESHATSLSEPAAMTVEPLRRLGKVSLSGICTSTNRQSDARDPIAHLSFPQVGKGTRRRRALASLCAAVVCSINSLTAGSC